MTSIEEKMSSGEIIFSETTGQAYFLDLTAHTSPSRSEHTRRQVAATKSWRQFTPRVQVG